MLQAIQQKKLLFLYILSFSFFSNFPMIQESLQIIPKEIIGCIAYYLNNKTHSHLLWTCKTLYCQYNWINQNEYTQQLISLARNYNPEKIGTKSAVEKFIRRENPYNKYSRKTILNFFAQDLEQTNTNSDQTYIAPHNIYEILPEKNTDPIIFTINIYKKNDFKTNIPSINHTTMAKYTEIIRLLNLQGYQFCEKFSPLYYALKELPTSQYPKLENIYYIQKLLNLEFRVNINTIDYYCQTCFIANHITRCMHNNLHADIFPQKKILHWILINEINLPSKILRLLFADQKFYPSTEKIDQLTIYDLVIKKNNIKFLILILKNQINNSESSLDLIVPSLEKMKNLNKQIFLFREKLQDTHTELQLNLQKAQSQIKQINEEQIESIIKNSSQDTAVIVDEIPPLERLKRRLKGSKQQLQLLQQQFKHESQQLNNCQEQWKQLQQSQQEIEQLTLNNQELKTQLTELENEKEKIKTKLKQKTEQFKQLSQNLESSNKYTHQNKQENKQKTQQLTLNNQTLDTQLKQLKQENEEITINLKQQIEQSQQVLQDLKSSNKHNQQTRQKSKQKTQQLTLINQTLDTQLKQLEKENEEIKTNLKQQIEQSQKLLQALESSNKHNQQQTQQLTLNNHKLDTQLKQLEEENKEIKINLKQQIEQYKQVLQNFKSFSNDNQQQMNELKNNNMLEIELLKQGYSQLLKKNKQQSELTEAQTQLECDILKQALAKTQLQCNILEQACLHKNNQSLFHMLLSFIILCPGKYLCGFLNIIY